MNPKRTSTHVLVTGASGFVGRHLVPYLVREGWPVRVALRRPYRCDGWPEEIAQVYVGEVNGNTDWARALDGIDAVVHLASQSGSRPAHVQAETYFEVNVQGTLNLARQAAQQGVQHFIFMSSFHAVAFCSDQPITERSRCYPESVYGQSKLEAEKVLIHTVERSPMKWTILRPAPIYGEGHRGNLHRLIQMVRTGVPLPVRGIRNQRSVLFIENLLELISVTLMNRNAFNQTFLVSDTEPLSTPALIRLVCMALDRFCLLVPFPIFCLRAVGKVGDKLEKVTKRRVSINTPLINGFLGSLYCDASQIQRTLQWTPPFSTLEGLRRTLRSGGKNSRNQKGICEPVSEVKADEPMEQATR